MFPTDKTTPFPFIIGSGRSGTTLLRAMLDSHPDVAIPGETYLLAQLGRRSDGFAPDGVFDRAAFEAELFEDSRFWTFYVDADDVRAELDRVQPTNVAEAIRATYRAHAISVGKSRWADKTPAYAHAADMLAELLPEAVFIHLHRDAREIVASYLAASWGYRTAGRAAAYWRLSVEAAVAIERSHPRRSLRIGYDDLVNDPEPLLRDLCALCELEYDPSMLDYSSGRVARISSTMDGDAHLKLLEPPKKSSRDWRQDLSPDEILRVNVIAGPAMRALGYHVPPLPWSVARIRAEAVGLVAVPVTRLELALRKTRLINSLRPRYRKILGRATTTDDMAETVALAKGTASS